MQLGAFSTALRHLLVLRNNMLSQIAGEQMMFLGGPHFGGELQPIDFSKAANAMGAVAIGPPMQSGPSQA